MPSGMSIQHLELLVFKMKKGVSEAAFTILFVNIERSCDVKRKYWSNCSRQFSLLAESTALTDRGPIQV